MFGTAFVFISSTLKINIMKKSLLKITGILVLSIFASCGSNKDLQERAPAQFADVYYTYTSEGIQLNIPVSVIQEERVDLQAVYFHGMKSPLVKSEENSNTYIANFRVGAQDMVMDVDSKKEYGNKMPQMPEKSPFKIDQDEAILVFGQNEKTKFYKLTGIVKKEE